MKASTKPASVHSRKSARAALDREDAPAIAADAIGTTHLDFAEKATGLTVERVSGPGWELVRGDCLSLLRELSDSSVDVTIGDPPYSEHVENGQAVSGRRSGQAVSGRRSGQAVIRKSKIGVGFLTATEVDALCIELVRITRRWIVLFCAFEQIEQYKLAIERAGGRYVRCCAWEKPDSTPQLTGDRPATWGECIIVAYAHPTGAMHWNGRGKRGLYKAGVCRGHERSDHPTQKPLDLMRDLVRDFSDPGESILDPFAGSGTTLIAASQLGRTVLGYEKRADYFAIATRRLRGEEASPRVHQPSLFGAP